MIKYRVLIIKYETSIEYKTLASWYVNSQTHEATIRKNYNFDADAVSTHIYVRIHVAYCIIVDTVKPHLAATSLIRPPHYSGHVL